MKYNIGDEVEGIITGIKPYGAFVCIDSKNQGLIHISEITNDFVADINDYVKVNEKIKVRILSIDTKTFQMRLSLKSLQSRKNRRFQHFTKKKTLPPMNIGFKTIEEKLPIWIDEALERIKND